MGIAAVIIGVVALILGLIPACGLIFGLPPAIIGLILGIVEIAKKGKKEEPKGLGIAGTILNAVAIAVILVWTLVIAVSAKTAVDEAGGFEQMMENAAQEMEKAVEEAAEQAAAEAEAAAEAAAEADEDAEDTDTDSM